MLFCLFVFLNRFYFFLYFLLFVCRGFSVIRTFCRSSTACRSTTRPVVRLLLDTGTLWKHGANQLWTSLNKLSSSTQSHPKGGGKTPYSWLFHHEKKNKGNKRVYFRERRKNNNACHVIAASSSSLEWLCAIELDKVTQKVCDTMWLLVFLVVICSICLLKRSDG